MRSTLTPDQITYVLAAAAIAYMRITGRCPREQLRTRARRRRRPGVGSAGG